MPQEGPPRLDQRQLFQVPCLSTTFLSVCNLSLAIVTEAQSPSSHNSPPLVCQRCHGKLVVHTPMSLGTSHNLPLETKGMAQPSLALENLQQIEKLSEIEQVNAEDVVIGALGSIYAGSELDCTLR